MVTLNEHVLLTETDTGTVLLDERSGRYWMTNGTGAIVLRSLAADGTVPAAVTALCGQRPGTDRDTAERDVAALLEQLRRDGLVRA